MSNIKEKINRRIYALLQKTEANGATREEALSAMAKAKQLAEEFAIEISDVTAPMQGEKMIVSVIDRYPSKYDTNGILYWLSAYFDVKVILSGNTNIRIYGYESDVELFTYFYSFVCRSCFEDLASYKQTIGYKDLKSRGYHGKTIAADFIKGYMNAVSQKLKADYNSRREARTESTALVLVEKEKLVNDFYQNETSGMRIGAKRTGAARGTDGYHGGAAAGSNLNLRHGVGSGDSGNKRIG